MAWDVLHKRAGIMDAFQQYLEGFFICGNSPSQGKVADLAGVSRVALNRIIKGHAKPSLDTAERIAKATGTTLANILRKYSKKVAV